MVTDRDRVGGRGYYRDLCFKVNALVDGTPAEIGDGGFTDWTARLLANGKERLLIAGYGLDRLAALISAGQRGDQRADSARAARRSREALSFSGVVDLARGRRFLSVSRVQS